MGAVSKRGSAAEEGVPLRPMERRIRSSCQLDVGEI